MSCMSVVFIILGILSVTPGVSAISAETCINLSSRLNSYRECYENAGLPFPSLPSDVVDKGLEAQLKFISDRLSKIHSTQTCKKLPQYKQNAICIMDNLRECTETSVSSQATSLLPTGAQLSKVFDLICKNLDDYDAKCVDKETNNMPNCQTVPSLQSMSGLSIQDIMCRSYQLVNECFVKNMNCDPTTKSLTKQIRVIMMPAMCQGNGFSTVRTMSTVRTPSTVTRNHGEGIRAALPLCLCGYIFFSFLYYFV